MNALLHLTSYLLPRLSYQLETKTETFEKWTRVHSSHETLVSRSQHCYFLSKWTACNVLSELIFFPGQFQWNDWDPRTVPERYYIMWTTGRPLIARGLRSTARAGPWAIRQAAHVHFHYDHFDQPPDVAQLHQTPGQPLELMSMWRPDEEKTRREIISDMYTRGTRN